jgi:ethanolamine utilization microcompartment shell protein EutL
MTCPQEGIPDGWRVWRGPVPAELGQFAVDALARISRFAYGSVAAMTEWQGVQVAAYKTHHTWSFRQGQLVTGICIPGLSLLVPLGAPVGVGAASVAAADLSTPDPSLAVYGSPPEETDWVLVGVSGVAIAATTAAFWLAIQMAGRASRRARA